MIKDEKGEVVVEASIILTLTVVFITVLIYLGFYIYHYTHMQVVANQAATNVAQIYSSEYKDPIYGYISETEFYKTDLYRNLTNVFTDSLDKANINVEYLYAFMLRTEKHAYVVLRVENNEVAGAALEKAGYHLITEADVCKL